jgi:hypothetical protein
VTIPGRNQEERDDDVIGGGPPRLRNTFGLDLQEFDGIKKGGMTM